MPYLDERELFKQYRLDEPWDSPNNLKVLRQMPSVYRHPLDKEGSFYTSYFAVVGPGTVFDPKAYPLSLGDITDGISNTLMIVEAKRKVPWTKPEDIAWSPGEPPPWFGGWFENGFNAVRCNAAVKFFRNDIPANRMRAWLLYRDSKLLRAPFGAEQARQAQEYWAEYLDIPVVKTNSIGMKLVLIPPGEFLMGSPADEEERDNDEKQHRVRITRPFYLGAYEVTQAEFQQVMGRNPSYFSPNGMGKGDVSGLDTSRFPVETVSWYDAVEFCNRLSQREGLKPYYRLEGISRRDDGSIKEAKVTVLGGPGYRLPTEAEWEYACRAGTTTPFHWGDWSNGTQSNVDGRSPYGTAQSGPYLEHTTRAGSYQPNAFGLYDMHGNVWEWCEDWYDDEFYSRSPTDDPVNRTRGTYRVLRGGSWSLSPWGSRSALRYGYGPVNRYSNVGFRLARTIE